MLLDLASAGARACYSRRPNRVALSAQSSRKPSLSWASFAPALAIVVPALGFVAAATWRASWATLGRDQGIFQYVAWAIARGDVAYRDVRDVNGPVVALVHLAFQALGGGDEHRFRVLDLIVTGASFAVVGAAVPLLRRDAPAAKERALWALAAWVVLAAQYLAYGYWDTAQRESFLDWFVAASLALQIGVATTGSARARRTTLALLACGAASIVPWLGKPTYALFTLPQLVAFALEPEPRRDRLRRLALFAGGGALGALGPLVFVALSGDVRAWLRITFVDVPAMYRFIWPRTASAILTMPYYRGTALLAAASAAAVVTAILVGRLPRRALPIAALPLVGLVSVVAQAKGFPYHFHPVTLGTGVAWIALASALCDRQRPRAELTTALSFVGGLALGVQAALLARGAPFPDAPSARDRASLESAERLAPYERVDFFPRALRDGAAYVAAHTAPGDRVQTYAMDAYFLFLAQRLSATPFVYAYDLNVDAALYGSFDPDGPRPSEAQREVIRAMRSEHERELLDRVRRTPPAAFVFVDRSPLMSLTDAVADFSIHCPETAVWLSQHYRQTADFDGVRVWLRADVTLPAEEKE